MRHGAQGLDTLLLFPVADLRYGPGGAFGLISSLHTDRLAKEPWNVIHVICRLAMEWSLEISGSGDRSRCENEQERPKASHP